ncbi:alpha/beta hydrolase [Croceibacterium sp. LX-88]|uniref:Alpha/beta hydrolase n=1 Tax=Croceibacterium selenioxidans TaxID=2838833 RepID=A0ABS5W3Y3_9SPHN|nr:alpha/beta hydrolase [Croceibacterium selenioxidans]MBT2134191.1 alpha/beta hydrolase [Croceibacterium selenioxidans]
MSFKSLSLGAAALAATLAAPSAHAQPANNVILIHGAFVDGSGWKGVFDQLVAKGFKVTVVQEPNTSLADDLQAVRRAIELQDGPVVLVGHSYGGQIITEAGVDPKVSALVYVAAIVPDVGESVGDIFEKMPSPTVDPFMSTSDGFLIFDPAKFGAGFAADLPEAETDFMANSQVPVDGKILGTKTQQAAWKTKPGYGIVAGLDMAAGTEAVRSMYKRANLKITEVPGASHAVYISHPREVADVIAEAASK